MENEAQPARNGELPGERLTRLGQASLRINGSLDVDTALQAVLDGKQYSGEARAGWRMAAGCGSPGGTGPGQRATVPPPPAP